MPKGTAPSNAPDPVGRGVHARRRILSAALELLADAGMRGFTMEAVARQAGASKATLYRHWPSASALLVDAMDAQFRPAPQPSTGDLRADLVAILDGFVRTLTDTPFPRLMAAFIDAAERYPELADLHTELTRRRRAPALRLLADAQARGEITLDIDPDVIVDLLAAPFFYRRFVAHRPIPADLPAVVVDRVLATMRTRDKTPDDIPKDLPRPQERAPSARTATRRQRGRQDRQERGRQ